MARRAWPSFATAAILPEALVNYLALLGWSPGENEELLPPPRWRARFDLSTVSHSAAVFDTGKLAWMNRHYMKEAPPRRIAREAFSISCAPGYVIAGDRPVGRLRRVDPADGGGVGRSARGNSGAGRRSCSTGEPGAATRARAGRAGRHCARSRRSPRRRGRRARSIARRSGPRRARPGEDGPQRARAVPSDSRGADGRRLGARAGSGRAGDRSRGGARVRRAGWSPIRSCAERAASWRVGRSDRGCSARSARTMSVIYGIHAVTEALNARRVSRLMHVRGAGPRVDALVARAHELRIPIETLDRRALDRLARERRASGRGRRTAADAGLHRRGAGRARPRARRCSSCSTPSRIRRTSGRFSDRPTRRERTA